MPNQPRTPIRTVRIEDDRWQPALAAAEKRGDTLSEVLRSALDFYAEDPELFWKIIRREP